MGKFRQIFMELSSRDTPIFSFPDNNLELITRDFNLMLYILTLRRSGIELLMGKFRQIFMELSARDTPIFSFPVDNLSK